MVTRHKEKSIAFYMCRCGAVAFDCPIRFVIVFYCFYLNQLLLKKSLKLKVQGIRDLFWLPIEQFQKDGRIVRGLQRGANGMCIVVNMLTYFCIGLLIG